MTQERQSSHARTWIILACALLSSANSAATTSTSASFRNSRSSIDSGGRRKVSAGYLALGALRAVPPPHSISTHYTNRDGLMVPDAVILLPNIRFAQEPYGISLTSAASVTLHWLPVQRYADGTSFADVDAPKTDELTAYHVYRATTPVRGVWTELAVLPTATLSWTDTVSGAGYYYQVRAENQYGLSGPSAIRSGGAQSAFIVAPDQMSYFELAPKDMALLEGTEADRSTSYRVVGSSRPEELGDFDGRVLKSLEFKVFNGADARQVSNLQTNETSRIYLHYELASNTQVAPSGLGTSAVAPLPSNMSVFWHNGQNWTQLYGKLDAQDQSMMVETKNFGRYQLRTAERTGGFAFNEAGLNHRFITPNGDHKNDEVIFTFDNPGYAAVTGRILDIRGRVIVNLPAVTGQSLVWNGLADGVAVPGGVYIYQISAQGQSYNGTIVVIK